MVRFRLLLMRFDYSIVHVPGKLLYTADTLSRAARPILMRTSDAHLLLRHVAAIISQLPASRDRLDVYWKAQVLDPICSEIISYRTNGRPEKQTVKGQLKHYWQSQHNLTIGEGLLLYQSRIVVPESLQHETLCKVHQGHQGNQRCRLRITSSVW